MEDDSRERSRHHKRAQAVLDEMLRTPPDPVFDNDIRAQERFDLHNHRVNLLIRENLDASSIWEFILLAGDRMNAMGGRVNVRLKLARDP